MIKVRDIMTRDVLSVQPDQSVDSARFAMSADFVSGVPVCNRDGVVVGVLSKTDLVDAQRRCATASVGDLMTHRVHAVRADDDLRAAVEVMVAKRVHRVIVTDDDGPLAGIVTPMDIMAALLLNDRERAGMSGAPA